MVKKICIIFILISFLSFIRLSYAESKNTSFFQIINKITGKSFMITVFPDTQKRIDNLIIKVNDCLIYNDKSNYASFLKVENSKNNKNLFSSWIFSNNPSISEFPHPIYAIKLVKCEDLTKQ